MVSLKALIPDRDPVEGMLNYGPESDERNSWNDQQKHEQEQKEISRLKSAAQDPLLRRLVTVHILATAISPDYYPEDSKAAAVNRCARWLEIIKQANLGRVEDAEYLGWVAYNNGDYKGAAHWLELSKGDSGAALWLRAKLQRRAGKLADAANTMAKAWESLRSSPAYNEREGLRMKIWAVYDFSGRPALGLGTKRQRRPWRTSFGARRFRSIAGYAFERSPLERCRLCRGTRAHHE